MYSGVTFSAPLLQDLKTSYQESPNGAGFSWLAGLNSLRVPELSHGNQINTNHRLTVALELDGVLASSTIFKPSEPCEFVEYETEEGTFAFYVCLRPGLQAFLAAAAQIADLIVYTTAAPAYATALLDLIDPAQTLFKKRFFRTECKLSHSGYVKDLNVLGLPLNNVLAVESCEFSACLQTRQVISLRGTEAHLDALYQFLETAVNSTDLSYAIRVFQHQQRQLL